ncbi:uncharacterized protein LOC119635946 [Glossina fuscipes]|uniref:Uncharacterized protein LOC119635946 n=1 Tax=Glossina fuscipes TaxID=7396 RepID=A0A9C5YZY6_9MUSC|nr:uncharacterized protein LOC119635946 [Glossina fuscipes]
MKFLSIFFIFGLLTVLGTLTTGVLSEPLPQPRGRPATTRRPKNDNDDTGEKR